MHVPTLKKVIPEWDSDNKSTISRLLDHGLAANIFDIFTTVNIA